ncbi:glycoside hydrolase family 2 TIM barrel-domain containing protein [Anaerobium acetethylicum]|uniref:Glycosyl hydrolases family 2 n=1 Tax=Anaerobium acetethylicum TaxID=1619234 RepID=A0A1D3TNG7_9FIRM|nr:glycoside hydrolase family 2 TIM barrel-domain containing protein [Anaerobium acetethylicum]SCP94853.1 Glycosyl hydrolases family 2 [Anaerobium acetethylicum]
MKRESFNQGWTYHKENKQEIQTVDLPHDAMIHETRNPESPGTHANAYFPGGVYIYEKTFEAPEQWREKTVSFEFEGVYKNSTVFINGKEAGGRPYGYVPFTVCADGLLNYGGKNTIRVVADNSKLPNSRWYSGGGIYRPVNLLVGNKTHIRWQGIKISTLSYAPAKIQVEVEASGGEITVEILYGNKVVAEGTGSSLVLEIPAAKLWSDDAPNRYQCRVTLKEDGRIVDEGTEDFGIRLVEWSGKGLFINGKETLLRGCCIHHDNGILGACTYAEAEERRVRILKESGYNAIRMSHHPASRSLLEACDRYGMYVMDETFDMWYNHKNKYDYASDFDEWYRKDMKAMVDQDFNHPSVIMYSIGNEVSEPYQERGVKLTKEMTEYLHSLDRNRAVTAGINLMIISLASKGKGIYKEEGGLREEKKDSGKKKQVSGSLFFNIMTSMIGTGMNRMANSRKADKVTSPCLDALDIAGYNYASGRYPLEGKQHPDRIVVGSETFPQDIAKNWKMVKKYPYLIGDFMWTGWDYIGEAAIGSWNYQGVSMRNVPYPWLLADVGAIDIIGTVGAQAKYASTVWGLEEKPYIGVRPVNHPGVRVSKAVWRGTNAMNSWAWKNCDGNKAEVEVYADAAKVELFVNGRSVGRKKIKEYKAMFKIRYKSGTITAVSYDGAGRETGRSELKSASGKTRIAAVPEEKTIKAGDIAFIDISIVGENGIVECNEDHKLNVTVKNGELLGFGSANPCTEEQFDSGEYTTYYGRALAAVRSKAAGELAVVVSGDHLPAVEVKVVVTK